MTNSEINSITSVYYIESYYIAYYKTKRSKMAKISTMPQEDGPCLEVFIIEHFIF
jgi:hypothetical protein